MINLYIIWHIIIPMLLSIIFGTYFIPILKKINAKQTEREDGPKSHLYKNGIPTMGGIIFLSALIILVIIPIKMLNINSLILLFATISFGIVGFIDDYIKVIKKRSLGLTVKQKLLLQFIISLILIFCQIYKMNFEITTFIPILKININLPIIIFIIGMLIVIIGTVNAANLTDGLDGLVTSVTIIIFIFFSIVALKLNQKNIFGFCLIFIGVLLGFLKFNKYPAKVFMGDTGSLALGGAVASTAMLLNIPLIIPVAASIYFIEALSVIIQVFYYKKTKKRIFLMAPLHHHFEQLGWSEKKVVNLFIVIQIISCIIAYYMIF